jgi:hypothetical protein
MKCIQAVLLLGLLTLPSAAAAQIVPPPSQDPPVQQPPSPPPVPPLPPDPAASQTPPPDQPVASDPDIPVNPLQPDFTLVGLPTTLRVPKGKSAFRVTHRFTRPLGRGDFGDLLADFFGFDSGAQIGLEFRYGLLPGMQIGIHRTSDRTIQLLGQKNLLNERDGRPVGLDFLLTLEGDDNLSEHHQSAVGFVLSRSAGRAGTFYIEPIFVANSNPFDTGDEHTLMLGIGTRLRVRRSLYFVAEVTPRLAGYDPLAEQVSFAIEGRTGGHSFQFNVSNGFGTTFGQLARGGVSGDDWFIGFNISRKFFR